MPDGSLHQKFGSWGDMKGAYRFFNSEKVSHEALQKNLVKSTYKLIGEIRMRELRTETGPPKIL